VLEPARQLLHRRAIGAGQHMAVDAERECRRGVPEALRDGVDEDVAQAVLTWLPSLAGDEPASASTSMAGRRWSEVDSARGAPGERFSTTDRWLIEDLACQAAVRLAEESRQLATDLQVSREEPVLAPVSN
jgi:hypothetical protein